MTQIEERYRKEQCSKCHLNNYCRQIEKEKRCDRFISLVKGATDQDPISYLRGRNDALTEMSEVIEQKIDKACEIFCETTCKGFKEIGRCFVDGRCQSYNEFRKALED